MKKINSIYLIIFTFLFLLGPNIVLATSGACSYHGGVNCTVGPDDDGNAICMDGTESSVSYASMEECDQSTTSYTSSTLQFDYDQEELLCTQAQESDKGLCGEMIEQAAMGGNYPVLCSPSTETTYVCNQAAFDKSELDEYNAAVQAPIQAQNSCTQKDPNSYATASGQCVCSAGYQPDPKTGVCETPTSYCLNTYGHSEPNSNSSASCSCQQGYELLNNTCVAYSSYCDAEYGQYATANSDGTCSVSCPSGATYDSSTHLCAMSASPIVTPPTPTITTPAQPTVIQAVIQKIQNVTIPVKKSVAQNVIPQVVSNTKLASSTQLISTTTLKNSLASNQKHWYEWLNPLSWFK